MTAERPENEQRKLAAFLERALDASTGLPDPRQLDDIPDEGVLWFAVAMETVMGMPHATYQGRTEALLGINAMIHQFRDSGIQLKAGDDRTSQ